MAPLDLQQLHELSVIAAAGNAPTLPAVFLRVCSALYLGLYRCTRVWRECDTEAGRS